MNWVEIFLLAIGAATLVAEIIALFTERGSMLISAQIRHNSQRWTFWPLLWGTLGGHFFGPEMPWRSTALQTVTFAIGGLFLARDLFIRTRVPKWTLLPIFLFGVLIGALLWSQR